MQNIPQISKLRQMGAILVVLVLSSCQAQFKMDEVRKGFETVNTELRDKQLLAKNSSDSVLIDDTSMPNIFYGDLYLGKDAWWHSILFDTMTEYTVIFDSHSKSSTSKQWMLSEGKAYTKEIELGPKYQKIQGSIYNDSMCLYHSRKERSIEYSGLCVENMPFILSNQERYEDLYEGIVGLARKSTNGFGLQHPYVTYVDLLKEQGKKAIVGFSYQDPQDTKQRSQIDFGEINFDQIAGGSAAANYYSNLGREKWGLLVDDMLLDGESMTSGVKGVIGYIDSGNFEIQVPEDMWYNILIKMQHETRDLDRNYRVIKERTPQGLWEMRIPNKNCKDVWADMKPISFKVQDTEIVIQPRGYTYQDDPKQGFCQIAFQESKSQEIRLGQIFLRNFYTALDYDNDFIIIGVNQASHDLVKANINGKKGNPNEKQPEKHHREKKATTTQKLSDKLDGMLLDPIFKPLHTYLDKLFMKAILDKCHAWLKMHLIDPFDKLFNWA